MDIRGLDLSSLNNYNCSQNTVHSVSAPVSSDSIFNQVANLTPNLKSDSSSKKSRLIPEVKPSLSKSSKTSATSTNKPTVTMGTTSDGKEFPVTQLGEKKVTFMGKEMKMSAAEIPGDEGGKEILYVSEDGKCMMSKNYDKDGNMLSVSQQLTDGDNYKELSCRYDETTGGYTSETRTKNMATGETSSTRSVTDKDGQLVTESSRNKKDGVETGTSTSYKNGEAYKETEYRLEDGMYESKTAKYNKKSGTYTDEEHGYDMKTGEQYTDRVKTDKDGNVLSKSTSEYANGESYEAGEDYDKSGNLVGKYQQVTAKDGSEERYSQDYNAQNDTYTTHSETVDAKSHTTQSSQQVSDANGNVISETNVQTLDNVSVFGNSTLSKTYDYKEYDSNGNVKHSIYSESSPGSYISEDTKIDENGQAQTTKDYVYKGVKYNSEAEYNKALDADLKTN